MTELLLLFLTFLKIGVVSFGGGYGMISILKDEVVANGWLTESQILDFIAVSESTPGPIAINMATFVGASQGGILGALLATLGVVLPSFLIILTIAMVLNKLLQYAGVKSFLLGIRPVVVGLIIATGLTMMLSVIIGISTIGSQFLFDWRALVILVLVFTLCFVYKKVKKKSISSIYPIILSACLGMLLYGVLGFL